MKPEVILQQLEGAAENLAVQVSYEPLSASVGHGGLCRVKGKYRVIIDKRASVHERLATLAQSLSQLDTSGLELSAPVREVLHYYSVQRAS
jgi:hypothetical protein